MGLGSLRQGRDHSHSGVDMNRVLAVRCFWSKLGCSRCEAGDDLGQRVIVGVRDAAARALVLHDARDRRVCAKRHRAVKTFVA